MNMATITKTGIEFQGFHITRRATIEKGLPAEKWYVAVGYTVLTEEGEQWNRQFERELTGAFKTKAASLLATVRAAILEQEGL